MAISNPLSQQLKETCLLTTAVWALVVERAGEGWKIGANYGLTKARSTCMETFLRLPVSQVWISGGLAGGRGRWRSTGEDAETLGSQRIYLFPLPECRGVVLVGADQLDRLASGFWRVVTLSLPALLDEPHAASRRMVEFADNFEQGVYYSIQDALAQITASAGRVIPFDAAWVGIRKVDCIQIEHTWKLPGVERSQVLLFVDFPDIQRMVIRRKGSVLDAGSNRWRRMPALISGQGFAAWMGVPIPLGKRVIGLFSLYRATPFESGEFDAVERFIRHVAPALENVIMLSEATHHLERMLTVSEVALTAASGESIDVVAHRIVRLLQKTFDVPVAGVLVPTADKQFMHFYGDLSLPVASFSVEKSMVGHAFETGQPVRCGDVRKAQHYLELTPGVRSELAVPLKLREQVVGVLSLESFAADAFRAEDEQFLTVIAGYLAGSIENLRLRQAADNRARNLELIYLLIKAMAGLLDEEQIAQKAADLLSAHFSGAGVMVVGHDVDRGLIVRGRAGESGLLEDPAWLTGMALRHQPGEPPALQVQSTRQVVLPLCDGERSLGGVVLTLPDGRTFSEADLMLIETLGGVLSNVFLNAMRYQALRGTVAQLLAVNQTALDISSNLDVQAVMRRVVGRVRLLVNACGADLSLIDWEKGWIKTMIADTPWPDYDGWSHPLDDGIVRVVLETRRAFALKDYNCWDGRFNVETRYPFHPIASVPLVYQQEVLGVLSVFDDNEHREFSAADLDLLEQLAPQIAVSLHNARLYDELQQRVVAQKEAEEQLVQSARMAAVGELAAGVANELSNPLTVVTGFLEVAMETMTETSPYYADLKLVFQEAQRANTVVQRLLDFSRLSDRLRVKTDINLLIEEVLALTRQPLEWANIALETHLIADLPWVSVDPLQIKQVILNLVQTAMQRMTRDDLLALYSGVIEAEAGRFLWFDVRDSGRGLSPEEQKAIFKPPVPANVRGRANLATAYTIVTQHGGKIELQSDINTGSCFRVLLPIEE